MRMKLSAHTGLDKYAMFEGVHDLVCPADIIDLGKHDMDVDVCVVA